MFCSGSGVVMQSGFHTSFNGGTCIKFLFANAVIDTVTKYVLVVIAAFTFAALLPSLACLRSKIDRPIVKSIVYGCQMVLGYWIMLLVMLYESVIFAAIIAGLVLSQWMISTRCETTNGNHVLVTNTPCCDFSE
jgi:hypothetical protein